MHKFGKGLTIVGVWAAAVAAVIIFGHSTVDPKMLVGAGVGATALIVFFF